MPQKIVTPAQLQAVKAQQEILTQQFKAIEEQRKSLAAMVHDLMGVPVSKPASKRRAAAPPPSAQPSAPKKVARTLEGTIFDSDTNVSVEVQPKEGKAHHNTVDSSDPGGRSRGMAIIERPVEWDNDEDLIADFLRPNGEDYCLAPVAHSTVCNFIAALLAERLELRNAVSEIQNVLADGSNADEKLLDAAIDAILAGIDDDDSTEGSNAGDGVDDEYVPSDEEWNG